MRPSAPILATLALVAMPVWASGDGAWAEFRTEVEAACAALVGQPGDVVVEVNPFGSEHYGAAIVTVTPEGGAPGAERMICIFDKTAKVAELTTPF